MIDRVELQRILGYIAEAEERKSKQKEEKKELEAVKVEVSEALKSSESVDYENLNKKVREIKRQLEENTYQVSPEKILIGLEKYISSK
ncbi:MAG: flagellar biosynthesis anti-sigma factor FlgM [Aquificaceae bacterium]|nr:flagellar biosynthesis anti-sigma factor FlgM [Aquificaceae bacterium]MDW8424006.1 flagellar biosynthesis anti-sigma factor FlgM [Aquificaceae bacterium]